MNRPITLSICTRRIDELREGEPVRQAPCRKKCAPGWQFRRKSGRGVRRLFERRERGGLLRSVGRNGSRPERREACPHSAGKSGDRRTGRLTLPDHKELIAKIRRQVSAARRIN